VHIRPGDLPGTFIQVDVASLGIDESQLSLGEYHIENLDFFMSFSPPESVFVFLVQANSAADQTTVDLLLDNPETLINVLTSRIGTEVSDKEVLTDLPKIGEKASGLSMVIESADQNLRMDIVVFRRQSVVGFAATMYPDGGEASVSVEQVAILLDGYLETALQE
jgi:hypothetical protein